MNGETLQARSLLARALNVAVETVSETSQIGELEAWDSLAHLRLVLDIEKFLGRELSADEIAELTSLADVHRLLAQSSDRSTGPSL